MPPSRTSAAAQAATFSAISVTFLGTASAQPSSTRNHSSLALAFGGRGDFWLFDCGEATQQRVQKSDIKMGKIRKIFITHTHGDHIFGIAPLMAGCMNGAGGMADGTLDPRTNPPPPEEVIPLEIYGPLGTRAFIRSALRYTHTKLEGRYVVHELRFPRDPQGDYTELPLHRCELPGKNLAQTHEEGVKWGKGVWNDIYVDSQVSVSAAPIEHSVSCVGYVVTESPIPEKMDPSQYLPHIKRNKAPLSYLSRLQRGEDITLADGTLLRGIQKRPGRKIVILGDTHNPAPVTPLAIGADLLIHEATNAYLPGIDLTMSEEDTEEIVQARTRSRGHSTPQMAGRFAHAIGARRLALNHFSARYRGDDDVNKEARTVMTAIKELAEKEFGGEVVCARDFMTLHVTHAR
ncbi:Metallo-hydrolase/oxidoreductase [Phellopilus nigrolimitatus]|nr:Metallo-hydrolase/oxidoreductase [Phellopilus nigrolimitatus]